MGMIIRELAFFFLYFIMKWKYRGKIWFRDISAIYAFKGSNAKIRQSLLKRTFVRYYEYILLMNAQ